MTPTERRSSGSGALGHLAECWFRVIAALPRPAPCDAARRRRSLRICGLIATPGAMGTCAVSDPRACCRVCPSTPPGVCVPGASRWGRVRTSTAARRSGLPCGPAGGAGSRARCSRRSQPRSVPAGRAAPPRSRKSQRSCRRTGSRPDGHRNGGSPWRGRAGCSAASRSPRRRSPRTALRARSS
jgi:hypothetical protein